MRAHAFLGFVVLLTELYACSGKSSVFADGTSGADTDVNGLLPESWGAAPASTPGEGSSNASGVPPRSPGAACVTNTDCDDPNQCVDGVCCTSACTELCAACNVPGSVGTCSAAPSDEACGELLCAGFDTECRKLDTGQLSLNCQGLAPAKSARIAPSSPSPAAPPARQAPALVTALGHASSPAKAPSARCAQSTTSAPKATAFCQRQGARASAATPRATAPARHVVRRAIANRHRLPTTVARPWPARPTTSATITRSTPPPACAAASANVRPGETVPPSPCAPPLNASATPRRAYACFGAELRALSPPSARQPFAEPTRRAPPSAALRLVPRGNSVARTARRVSSVKATPSRAPKTRSASARTGRWSHRHAQMVVHRALAATACPRSGSRVTRASARPPTSARWTSAARSAAARATAPPRARSAPRTAAAPVRQVRSPLATTASCKTATPASAPPSANSAPPAPTASAARKPVREPANDASRTAAGAPRSPPLSQTRSVAPAASARGRAATAASRYGNPALVTARSAPPATVSPPSATPPISAARSHAPPIGRSAGPTVPAASSAKPMPTAATAATPSLDCATPYCRSARRAEERPSARAVASVCWTRVDKHGAARATVQRSGWYATAPVSVSHQRRQSWKRYWAARQPPSHAPSWVTSPPPREHGPYKMLAPYLRAH